MIEWELKISKLGKWMDVPTKSVEGRSAIPWSSWEMMEWKGQGLHVSTCLLWEKGHPAPIFWAKFSGVIPSRIGMSKIAVTENMIFNLLDIEDPQNRVWTCLDEKQHLCQGFSGCSKQREPLRITKGYHFILTLVFGGMVWNSSTKMTTKEDGKYKFCFVNEWLESFRQILY